MVFTRCILGTWGQHMQQNVGYSANKTKSTPGCHVVKRVNRDRAVIFIFSERNDILIAFRFYLLTGYETKKLRMSLDRYAVIC